jgi:eukaryotic-like serine/threonine-protein kinase
MLETLGRYRILERIGAGGVGELYRARDTAHGRTVALRVVREDLVADAQRHARFLEDARKTAALSHPSIATVFETGEDQGRLFLASEYVPGQTLRAAIGGHAINPRRAVAFAAQIADALAEAHFAGIVHGDIRPDNVIVTPKGNAKVIDVGLAAWTLGGAARARAGRATTTTALQDGVVARTAPYMSPEQALGEPVDFRTDIFSLGVVLFEMLTGRVPFLASAATEVTEEAVHGPLVAPTTLNRSLPPEIDTVVDRMLAKSPADRYESAETAAAALRSIGAILDARGPAAPPSAARAPNRSSGIGWFVAAVILAAIAALVWFATRV